MVLAGRDLKKKQLGPNHVGSLAIWSLSWLLYPSNAGMSSESVVSAVGFHLLFVR